MMTRVRDDGNIRNPCFMIFAILIATGWWAVLVAAALGGHYSYYFNHYEFDLEAQKQVTDPKWTDEWKSANCFIYEKTMSVYTSSSGDGTSSKNFYNPTFLVKVITDELNDAGNQSTWSTWAEKYPSWNYRASTLGGGKQFRADDSLDNARAYRKVYKPYWNGDTDPGQKRRTNYETNENWVAQEYWDRGYQCWYDPKHPKKVSMKRGPSAQSKRGRIAGYSCIAIGMFPMCFSFFLYALFWLSELFMLTISPCLHAQEDLAHSEGRHPPDTIAHSINRGVHSFHRESSRHMANTHANVIRAHSKLKSPR
mmetsp:Transcript_108580/g.315811  ORF Transcript_108580/g.315811 Transcript_108580/m.315811 type:complete len:310 (+) Transcript_108580:206-1135(+)